MFRNSEIEGVVLNELTLAPVSQARLDFYRIKSSGFFNKSSKQIDVSGAFTGEEGQWYIKTRFVGDPNYHLTTEHDDYYSAKTVVSDPESAPDTIFLVPKGYVRLSINIDPTGPYEKIHLELNNPSSTNTAVTTCKEYLPVSRLLEGIGDAFNVIEYTLIDHDNCWGGPGIDGPTITDTIWVPQSDTANYSVIL